MNDIAKYNVLLFNTLTNTEFADLYDITRSSAFELRKKLAPHTSSEEILKLKRQQNKNIKINNYSLLILKYFKENPQYCENFSIAKFCIENKITNFKTVRKSLFIKIAKENDIKLVFKTEYVNSLHGLNCGIKRPKCNCDVYKLANSLAIYFFRRKLKVPRPIVNEFANKYLQVYKSDNTKNHGIFYKVIMKKLKTKEEMTNYFLGISSQ